ncbi:MAG TPA: hypothetical protein VFR58_17120 [Flavisolibacter sp.]|nr:hypothetical protein [Flavisolibacter sp.]
MKKIFDFHYHLLFKHYISDQQLQLADDLETRGFAKLLNGILGGPFDSQSSPSQVSSSPLYIGVIAILSLEHAFANRVLHILGADLSGALPINKAIFKRTKNGETDYYTEFKDQVQYHVANQQALAAPPFRINFLRRDQFLNKSIGEIEAFLQKGEQRHMLFSIEGGHNLSPVSIRKQALSKYPEKQLLDIQENSPLDFISINLCHLSEIPEQSLGGFAQGVNGLSQIAFRSEDFMPRSGIGVTELGKKVIRQALTHPDRPLLIDIKHMSLYTRLHFYRIREKLIQEDPGAERLPIISSHSGFCFTTASNFIGKKLFRSRHFEEDGKPVSIVEPENRKMGRTDDRVNRGLYCNPWTINLFDEDIVEIMDSGGMIGISLDQRILGASNPGIDSIRDKYYEGEYVSRPEWERLFRDGQLPGLERTESLEGLAPSRPERHMMLLCLHLVYAVRVGYANLNWAEGTSPWDCLCIGSDFDGLINPINGFENISRLDKLEGQLKKYLPQADKYLDFFPSIKALKYNGDGSVEAGFLQQVIDKFMFGNGLRFTARFLTNWTKTA